VLDLEIAGLVGACLAFGNAKALRAKVSDVFDRLGPDLARVADDELEGLAEILMRLFVSFLQYPADPPRSEDELRALVRRWLGPALEAKPSRAGR